MTPLTRGLSSVTTFAFMIDTSIELLDYLDTRGARYGISGQEILNAIPAAAQEPKLAYQYMQQKDISHIIPLSQGGDPAGDNWILEDSAPNRGRGAQPVTTIERASADIDGQIDATLLRARDAAILGGSLAAGSSIVESAIVAAELTAVAVPLLTLAAVGGIGYCVYRVFK